MNKKEVIAVDIGGTNLRTALIRNNKTARFIRKPTPKNKDELLAQLTDSISEIFEYSVAGIGVSSPGPLKNGVILNPPNIPLKNLDLKKFLEKRFNVKTEVENDAKCVALAELNLGYGKGKKDFFVLTLGTGIGGGLIIDEKLYNKKDIGCELGSIYLADGKKFEDAASGRAIKKLSLGILGKEMNISDLIKLNDKKARDIVENVTESLAQGIGSLINIFNPEIVILAGGMREAGEEFLNLVQNKAISYIVLPAKYDIVWSKLEEPGLLGAGLLVG